MLGIRGPAGPIRRQLLLPPHRSQSGHNPTLPGAASADVALEPGPGVTVAQNAPPSLGSGGRRRSSPTPVATATRAFNRLPARSSGTCCAAATATNAALTVQLRRQPTGHTPPLLASVPPQPVTLADDVARVGRMLSLGAPALRNLEMAPQARCRRGAGDRCNAGESGTTATKVTVIVQFAVTGLTVVNWLPLVMKPLQYTGGLRWPESLDRGSP